MAVTGTFTLGDLFGKLVDILGGIFIEIVGNIVALIVIILIMLSFYFVYRILRRR